MTISRLSEALIRITDRLSTHMDDRVQLAFKMDQWKPRTSMPEAVLEEVCVKRGCFPPLPIVMGRVLTSVLTRLLSQVE